MKMEEEFKFLWRTNHPELDLEYIGKYDAKSKCGGLIIEFKKSCADWKKMITQALLTSAKEGKKFKIVGAVSQEFPEGKFIDTFDCKISIRSVKAFNAIPSSWNSTEWQLAHRVLEPLYKERMIPTRDELIQIENSYQLNSNYTKNRKQISNLPFGKFCDPEFQIIKETEWAAPEELDKLNAYYTPEHLRTKVKEIVNKNWPDLKYIWDPYGGDGALVNQFDCEVLISDIEPQGSGIIEMDFIKDKVPKEISNKFGPNFAVVTNPSFGKKHIHNLINFCRNNKIKLATFGYCGNFPFEDLEAADCFLTQRGTEWKNILVQYGWAKNHIIPFILFDFDLPKISKINHFEFTNTAQRFPLWRIGDRSIGKKLPDNLYDRLGRIDIDTWGGLVLTEERMKEIIKTTPLKSKTGKPIRSSLKKITN